MSGESKIGKASGGEYESALKGMMPGAAGESARGPRPSSSGRPARIVLMLIVAVGGGYSALDFYDYVQPPEPPSTEVQRRAARIMLFTAAQAVERYRAERGHLPAGLTLLHVPKGDWDYVRADTGYTIYLSHHEVVLSYRSGDDYQRLLDQAGVR